ncbi:carbamoyl phosphate synthetase [Cyclospora cayetanensis]|uniref:Carbamoyl phosphate synthetase n=1 Tax=Cyclospora cayetanensis TaxID=88456 RepID=A0A1D3D518_9EIME|nr:carbamoyl phosphate synthetase [Cyclospora cayetanensis]
MRPPQLPPEKELHLAAAFAAAVEKALSEEATLAATWGGVPLGLNDEKRMGMLLLQDGRQFLGISFGCSCAVSGEVVFNTGMVAYPESLTDPSYAGQILTLTYPIIGNYGVPSDEKDSLGLPLHLEGARVHVTALLTADYVPAPLAHWRARSRLGDWLKAQGVPALCGIDTRALTKHLRKVGAMLGKVVVLSEDEEAAVLKHLASPEAAAAAAELLSRVSAHPEVQSLLSHVSATAALQQLIEERVQRAARLQVFASALKAAGERLPLNNPNLRNLVADVSPKQPKVYVSAINASKPQVRILAVDCGMKANIYRQFLYTNFEGCNIVLKAVPWDYDFTSEEYDGLFISNGPGDPEMCKITIAHLAKALKQTRPIFGICLGNQLLALAAGAKTYKMKFGNRESLPPDYVPLFVNANDRSNEGISHRSLPFFSAQFHPEAAGGPTDTFFLFSEFIDSLKRQQFRQLARCIYTIPYQFPSGYRKILLLGSGGLSIGQAGEFDYSGSQAIKALREHNITVVLVNPNIATVQTSKHMAHRVYFVPVTPQFVSEILEKERPQGVLCSFGGQTALNCVVELHRTGILKKYDCQVLGTPIEAIISTEDREIFAQKLMEIGEQVAPSAAATNVEEAVAVAARIGYPVLIRAAFALGNTSLLRFLDTLPKRMLLADLLRRINSLRTRQTAGVFRDRSVRRRLQLQTLNIKASL